MIVHGGRAERLNTIRVMLTVDNISEFYVCGDNSLEVSDKSEPQRIRSDYS